MSAEDIYERGWEYYQEEKYAEAAKLCRCAAEQGNADAQYLLATIYEEGRGVPQDYAEAVKWFRLAAEQGHARAQYFLVWRMPMARALRRMTRRRQSGIVSPPNRDMSTRNMLSA